MRLESSMSSIAVISDHQSKGKGQANRHWESESCQNVLMSVHYPCNFKAESIPVSAIAVALALREQVELELKRKVLIKWPNDILVGKKKVAGILCQSSIIGSRVSSILVGIGLNVNQVTFALPNAVSLCNVDGKERDSLELALRILKSIDKYFLARELPTFKSIEEEYHNCLFGYNKLQSFKIDKEEVQAMNRGIDEFGRLKVELENEIKTFLPKEIELV